jgi:hypothetical protein
MALEERASAEITATLDATGSVVVMHRRIVTQIVRDGEVMATEATAALPIVIADLIAMISPTDFAKIQVAVAAREAAGQ